MHIVRGLRPEHRLAAGHLYWGAFQRKLNIVHGPDHLAIGYFAKMMRETHCLSAISDSGALIGLVGFSDTQGNLIQYSFADMAAFYGYWGAFWRMALLMPLHKNTPKTRFVIEGVCVTPPAQRQGVGFELMAAIIELAHEKGYNEIELEVATQNIAAKNIYIKHGFKIEKTSSIWPFDHVFGFKYYDVMLRLD